MATTKIKDPVEGIIDLDRLPGLSAAQVRRIIDSPELQRLRQVKQLGFTEFVYPGATHTRFAHSLGTFQGAQRTMHQLIAAGGRIPDEWYVATAFACLLHDLGHGPFSHTFEAVTGERHELWTRRLLEDGPCIPELLEDCGAGTGARVQQLLAGEPEVGELGYLADLVSSALDCDRMDYLRRDALHTGTHYGSFDRDWLIRGMVPSSDGRAVVVLEKGLSAVEEYLIGRYHMFQNVYLHKTSRGFETAFRGLCQRLRTLGASSIPAGARGMRVLFEDELDVERYLGLNDSHFKVDFDLLIEHEDATVRALAQALRSRRPLRCRATTGPAEELAEELARQRELAGRAGLDPECAVWRDEAKDVPYQPYTSQTARKSLRILRGRNELVEVADISPTITALAGKKVVHRLYWLQS